MGINPVVVHGGGPQIGNMLKKLGVESRFVDGLRVTDKATAEVAEMVLSGAINKELVGWIAKAGGKALGISGKDGGLVTASKVQRTTKDPDSQIEQVVDLGFVGEPQKVETSIIKTICEAGMIPVIAPIACGADGETYNINADTMAGAIAAALGAARLFLLTDVSGVLDKQGNLLTDLRPADIAQLQQDGTIWRHDSQAGNMHPCGGGRVRGGGGARWPGAACHAAGNLHFAGRGHAYPGGLSGNSCRQGRKRPARLAPPALPRLSGGTSLPLERPGYCCSIRCSKLSVTSSRCS